MPKSETPFLTTHDIADFLGVSAERIRQLMKEGKLPSARRGRQYLVPQAAWQEYVDALTTQARASLKTDTVQESSTHAS